MLGEIAKSVLNAALPLWLDRLFTVVCYWPGWRILRILTLGQYPPRVPRRHNREFVASVPLVVALAVLAVYCA